MFKPKSCLFSRPQFPSSLAEAETEFFCFFYEVPLKMKMPQQAKFLKCLKPKFGFRIRYYWFIRALHFNGTCILLRK